MECKCVDCGQQCNEKHYILYRRFYCDECYENKIRLEQRDAALESKNPFYEQKVPIKRKRA